MSDDEDPLRRQAKALREGRDEPDLVRFLLYNPERGKVVGLGAEYPSGQVVIQNEGDSDVQVWPSREEMLLHKPMSVEDIIWWDEPPHHARNR